MTIFPVVDGTVKICGGDQRLITSTLIQDRPNRREEQGILQGEPDKFSSNTLQQSQQDDSTRDDTEAKYDFWPITGDFIYRHHVEPRVKLYVPKEESFSIPVKYIDVSRHTRTSLDDRMDIHGPRGDWQENKRPPGQTLCGQKCGNICPLHQNAKKSKSGQSRNQNSKMPEDYESIDGSDSGISKKRLNSLSDAREFSDPESGSSSGATHVPDRASTILSPGTLPRCDSGLPRNTQNCTSITGYAFERPLAQEGLSSTIGNNSKNSASSSQELKPDTTDTSRQSDGMKKESFDTPIQAPHFQCMSRMLSHTAGTWFDQMIFVSVWNLGKFLDSMEFQSWKVHFRTDVCLRTADLQITMLWIKEADMTNLWHRDRLRGNMIFLTSIRLMQWLRQPWKSLSRRSHISGIE